VADIPSGMPVVILAGGFGTRLQEESVRVPKPLVEIGGQPILWHIMKLYDHFGARRFIICLGYRSWAIKQYFLSYREQLADFTISLADDHEPVFRNKLGNERWEVTCAETGQRTGTGGRLWRVREYIDTDTFMFTYGDGIGALDIGDLLAFHRQHGRIGTVTGVNPTSRYGEMRVRGDEVLEFNEKPTKAEGFVSGGFFVLNRGIFDYLNEDAGLYFEAAPLQQDVLERCLAARERELVVDPLVITAHVQRDPVAEPERYVPVQR
jgi:glucose-1-phosphate cytidylyltransferase